MRIKREAVVARSRRAPPNPVRTLAWKLVPIPRKHFFQQDNPAHRLLKLDEIRVQTMNDDTSHRQICMCRICIQPATIVTTRATAS
jgi:hypothetical protein